jgi:hypothetical protein
MKNGEIKYRNDLHVRVGACGIGRFPFAKFFEKCTKILQVSQPQSKLY